MGFLQCSNTLIVSFPCVVLELEKESETTQVLYRSREGCIMGVLCICPCILLTIYRCNESSILVMDPCGELIGCYQIDSPAMPQNLIYHPCTPECHSSPIWAFVFKKNVYPYLCRTDLSLEDLGFLPCPCNDALCEGCCGWNKPDPDCDPRKDIMESIALIETALSHILNAEGEKIQKVLATTDDIDQILCVNREVNQTIVNATHLEHTLYNKLSALSDCGLFQKECAPCDPCQHETGCTFRQPGHTMK